MQLSRELVAFERSMNAWMSIAFQRHRPRTWMPGGKPPSLRMRYRVEREILKIFSISWRVSRAMRLKVPSTGFCARADTRRSQVCRRKGGLKALKEGGQKGHTWDTTWER